MSTFLILLACSSPSRTASSRPVERGESVRPPSALDQAHRLRRAGEMEAARAAYETVLAEHPDDVLANLSLGELHRAEGRCETALPYLHAAAAHAPESPEPHEHLAACLQALGRLAEADEAQERARALGSESVGEQAPLPR